MGELVRDQVPDLIRASGRAPRVTTLDVVQYRAALGEKLQEEAAELLAAGDDGNLDEAADVLEALTAIAAEHGYTLDTIVDAACRKRASRGGFIMRLRLDGIDEKSAAP